MRTTLSRLRYYVDLADTESTLLEALPHRVDSFSPGDNLVKIGNPLTEVFFVEDGWAIRFRLLDDGRRQIVNFMLPGDCFDLQALISAQADHFVDSITPVTIRVVPARAFLETLANSARLAAAFWWAAIQEESILREQIVRIGRRSARERIAHLILELYRRRIIAGAEEDETLELPATRDMIADALGLTSVHVSRTITELRRNDLISTQNGTIRIVERAKLAAIAGFEDSYLHIQRTRLMFDPNNTINTPH